MKVRIGDDGVPRYAPTPGFSEHRQAILTGITAAAKELGLEVESYSGKFMYGAKCPGVIVTDTREFLLLAVRHVLRGGRRGKAAFILNDGAAFDDYMPTFDESGPTVENFRPSWVIYWPDYALDEDRSH